MILRSSNQTLIYPQLCLPTSFCPWISQTELVTKDSAHRVWLYKDQMAHSNGSSTPDSHSSAHKVPQWTPSYSRPSPRPQITCRLDVQTPIVSLQGWRVVQRPWQSPHCFSCLEPPLQHYGFSFHWEIELCDPLIVGANPLCIASPQALSLTSIRQWRGTPAITQTSISGQISSTSGILLLRSF